MTAALEGAEIGGTEMAQVNGLIANLVTTVTDLRLEFVVLNERLPAHIESTNTKLGEHDTRLKNHGDRIYSREKEAIELRAELAALKAVLVKPKLTWPTIVAGVVGIITGVSVLVGLIVVLASIAPALAALK